MAAKLENLTAEQLALIPMVRDEWIQRALGGDTSINLDAVRGPLETFYRATKFPSPPPYVIVMDSYHGCQIAANVLLDLLGPDQVRDQVWAQVRAQVWDQVRTQVGNQVWDQVRTQVGNQVRAQVGAQVRTQVWDQVRDQVGAQVWAQVRAQVRDQVEAQVWDQVRDQVWDQVRTQVGNQVWDQVRDQVWDQVWDQVEAQVRDQVRTQVGNQVRDQVRDQVWDQDQMVWFEPLAYFGLGLDSGWLAWGDYWNRIGIKLPIVFTALKQFALAGVWDAILLPGCAILCRRPKRVHLELQENENQPRRLHRADGPAVEWESGPGNYFLHGMRVQAEWIEHPERITVQQVLKEKNVELRRALVTLMGMERFVREGEFKVVDQDHDASNMPRRLLRKEMPEDEPLVLVEVQCPSTGKIAHLRVPPTCVRCSEAVAWTFGFEAPETYRPAVEA